MLVNSDMVYMTRKEVPNPFVQALKFIFFILLIAAVVGGYLFFHPEMWKEWVKGTSLEPPPQITTTYKWRDANGQWQVSDHPPKGDTPYETMIFNSDTNIMPSLKIDEE